MKEQYEKVPNIISGKDLEYLSDMFQWNYIAYKKAVDAYEEVTDENLAQVISKCVDAFQNHLEIICNVVEEGGAHLGENC